MAKAKKLAEEAKAKASSGVGVTKSKGRGKGAKYAKKKAVKEDKAAVAVRTIE